MRKFALTSMIVAAALAITACSTVQTEPDQQALRYSNPNFGAKEFQEHYGPSSYDMNSLMNTDYTYPAGQRVFAFQENGGDTGVMTPTTKDGVTLKVSGSVRFALTSDPEQLKQFHEKIGLRMKAFEDEGWREFLRIYLEAPINRALTDATQGLEWSAIYSDPKVKAEWEKQVGELLPRYVEQAIGGNYVGEFQVTLGKPVLPEDLEKALQDAQVAVQQTRAQEERNSQVQSELESIKPLVDILGPEGYNVYQAIKDGRVTIMPIPAGTDLAVANQ